MAAPVGTNLAAVQDLVFLVLQFLEEEQLKDAAHSLERLTGLYFDLAHVESLILAGELDKCEEYIAGFTTIQDNAHSLKLFFELRKTKYLEALDARDFGRAVDILRRELQVFAEYSQEIFSEITSLISLNNFRENEKLKDYGDKAATRKLLLMEVNKLVAQNPILGPRCQLPPMPRGMLKTLVTQAIAMASGGGQPVLPTPRHHPPHHPSYAGVAATGKASLFMPKAPSHPLAVSPHLSTSLKPLVSGWQHQVAAPV